VTFCRSFSCRTSALTNAAPINSRERLKKSVLEFYTSSQNRFSQRKNLSNTSEIRWSPKRRNTRQKAALVTTDHVFWPKPTKESRLLATVFATELRLSRDQLQRDPPGGVARRIPLGNHLIDYLTRKFYPRWPT
jgi:hypothetical protein